MIGRLFWLASYPKSGNTWFRAFLRNLGGGSDPASINDLGSTSLAASRAWMDEMLGFDTGDLDPGETERLRPTVYRFASHRLEGHAYRKIHDACHRTDAGTWIVDAEATAGALYLIRNPLDVAISYAHHAAHSIDDAIAAMADPDHRLARDDGTGLKPQVEQRLLTWSDHVMSWVDNPDIPIHVLRYEDMQTGGAPVFAEAARFLKLEADRSAIERAVAFSSFDTLKSQEDRDPFRERAQNSARFFRKGVIGDWQTTLSGAQIDSIVEAHGAVMRRFGYCDAAGTPRAM
ncbi:sulfotransferase domain-containing protein [Pelagerythrobacter sp.]|uniref:sulfotransferase domain-containing protein n=1 Tax=Pelagerythrobacter sp. TaxID=2800702 RepID=UPI0035B3E793